MKIGSYYVTAAGVEFDHDGDNVLWIWPWKRSAWRRRYMSFGFDAVFESLEEVDREWEGYFQAIAVLEEMILDGEPNDG